MKLNKLDLVKIIDTFREKYSLEEAKITDFRFYDEKNYWIVTETYSLFGEDRDFFYMISDETEEVIQTMNEHGVNPHLPVEIKDEKLRKEWEDFENE